MDFSQSGDKSSWNMMIAGGSWCLNASLFWTVVLRGRSDFKLGILSLVFQAGKANQICKNPDMSG